MATQVTPNATTSDGGQRRQTIGGTLAANRHLRAMAIIGVLALALAASLALDRALQSDQAGSAAMLPVVADRPGFTDYREEHRPVATAFAPGFAETRVDHRLAAAVGEPGFTTFREDYRVPLAVRAPGFTDYREDHRADGALVAGGCGVPAGTGWSQQQDTCEAFVAQQVAVRQAWEWTLCWDEGEACEVRLAGQRPSWEARAWVLCVDMAPSAP